MIPTPRLEIYDSSEESWVDITAKAKSYSITRGRSNIFGYSSAGQLSVQLNNHDRAFDPTFTDSPYYGLIVPQIPTRIYVNDAIQFTGTIDDWDLSYTPSFDNIASFTATDAFSDWATKTIGEYNPTSLQLTSQAIDEALNEIGITDGGPATPAGFPMGTAVVEAGTNALQYVQKLATSDFGSLFIKKDGTWDYQPFSRRITGVIADRIASDNQKPIHLADVAYGTENLYNKIVFTYADTGETVTVTNDDSIALYGVRELTDSATLISGFFGLYGQLKAQEILELYSAPELRIDSISLYLHDYAESNQDDILALELGDRVIVSFDPNNSGSSIARINRIIGIDHSVNPQEHVITFNFESSSSTPWTLGDPDLGRLSAGNFLEKTWDFSI